MALELELDAETFQALAGLVDGPYSPISPWAGADRDFSDSARARLSELGVGDDPATISRDLQPTLSALAAATAATTVQFVGAGALVAYAAWVSADHGPIGLSMTPKWDRFRLCDPAPTDQVIEFLAGLVGRSPLRGFDLAVDLQLEDSLVLAAVVDVQRRRILTGLATGHPEPDEPVQFGQLRTALDEPPAIGFSLVDAISRRTGLDASRATPGLADSIARLAEQGLLDADSASARPIGACAPLAEHFAAISSVLDLMNATDDTHDGIRRVGFTCLQSGVSDLITVEWIDGSIHLETVSADTVVGYLDRFLRRPDFAARAASAPAEVRPESRRSPEEAGATLPPEVAKAPPDQESTWRPTHSVPEGGIPAWVTPDPGKKPVTRIAAGAELQVLGWARGWAHVARSSGWTGWVDGRAIARLPTSSRFASPPPGECGSVGRPPSGPNARDNVNSTWRPTHLAPDGGMPAWTNPDPTREPVSRIAARAELQLLERKGGWARVACANGWSAWVNARGIEALPGYPQSQSTGRGPGGP